MSFFLCPCQANFEIKMKIDYSMDIFLDRIKEFYWLLLTALFSVFSPVKHALIFLMIAFMFNIISGIITDVHVNRAPFSLKKAFNAFTQLLFYAVCVVFLDYGARLMGDADIGITAVKWLTYIVVYFYLANIFRNARLVYPKSAAINFIYDLLSTEIFSRLKDMIGIKNNKDYQND